MRILAACSVIWLHTNLPWGIPLADGANNVLLHIFEAIAIPAVDIFILITGYFMVNRKSVSVGKPVNLLLQYFIISAFFILPAFLYHYPHMPFNVKLLLPNDYFITLYIAMYFFSPYLNKIVSGLNSKQIMILFFISVFFLSVYPIFWDYVQLYTSLDTGGISTVSRWHDDMGNNITTFLLIYLIGALMKKVDIISKINMRKVIIIWLFATTLIVLLYYQDEMVSDEVFGSVTLFYHNPLVITQAVSLFIIFKKIRFKSGIINKLAAAAFTCYILQGYLLGCFRNESFFTGNSIKLILFYILVPFAIFLISYVVYVIYSRCTNWIVSKLEYKEIVYYN